MTLTLVWPWPYCSPWLQTSQTKLNWCLGRKLEFPWDDIDLDPMTLILKLDLDMVKMYHHTKNEVYMSTGSKVIARTHTHTDTTKTLPLPHTREVIISICIKITKSQPPGQNLFRDFDQDICVPNGKISMLGF